MSNVLSSPYNSPILTGTINWQTSTPSREFLQWHRQHRIRQSGKLLYFTQHFQSDVDEVEPTSFRMKIWRGTALTALELIWTSEELVSKIDWNSTGSVQQVSFDTPPDVLEGDIIGYRFTANPAAGLGHARVGIADIDGEKACYYFTGASDKVGTVDWTVSTSVLTSVWPFQFYIVSPRFVAIGDSLIAGHTGHYAYTETTTDTVDLDGHISAQISALWSDAAYQNMGIGSQTTTQIEARFAADCVALAPTYAIVNGGVNDIAGAGSMATYIANWTSILDQCTAADIVPVVLEIWPWTNGTTEQMQARDTWTEALRTLCESYPRAIVVNMDSTLGTFRAGGDAGNYWDIKPLYDVDGIHINQAGYTAAAAAVFAAISAATNTGLTRFPSVLCDMIGVARLGSLDKKTFTFNAAEAGTTIQFTEAPVATLYTDQGEITLNMSGETILAYSSLSDYDTAAAASIEATVPVDLREYATPGNNVLVLSAEIGGERLQTSMLLVVS